MEFKDLPPDVLRELVKWAPSFAKSCHLLSKSIYLATRTTKLNLFKTTPIRKFEIERHVAFQQKPFGCVGVTGDTYSNVFFTSRLWCSNTPSFDIKGYIWEMTINLGTVKSYCDYQNIRFDMAGNHLLKYPGPRKSLRDETLGQFLYLTDIDRSIMTKAIKFQILLKGIIQNDVYLDCLTVFQILSARTSFSLELSREQTLEYFNTCIAKLKSVINIFIYCYITYLRLGLDSIHNLITYHGPFNDTGNKLVEMQEQIRKRIGELE